MTHTTEIFIPGTTLKEGRVVDETWEIPSYDAYRRFFTCGTKYLKVSLPGLGEVMDRIKTIKLIDMTHKIAYQISLADALAWGEEYDLTASTGKVWRVPTPYWEKILL